jgi:hypothetical protein
MRGKTFRRMVGLTIMQRSHKGGRNVSISCLVQLNFSTEGTGHLIDDELGDKKGEVLA